VRGRDRLSGRGCRRCRDRWGEGRRLVPGCAVEVATDRASRRRCPWARLSSQPRSGFGALQLGLVPTTRLVPMRARSSRPDASQAELCSAERAMRHHGGRGARRAVRPAGFGEDHVLPRVDATGVALCRTPLPPDRGRIGLRPRATGLVGSLVGSLRHGTRCTGPHQMDDGANRTAAQGTGQGTMDERIWTPNPQVLGSNPRGRTRKSPGQRSVGRPSSCIALAGLGAIQARYRRVDGR